MKRLIITIMLFFAAPTVSAELFQKENLMPFSVGYRVNVSRIPTTIKAELTLAPLGDNRYQLSLEANSLLLKNKEETAFTWDSCFPHTESYSHYFKGFRRERNYQMTFMNEPRRVLNLTHEKKEDSRSKTYLIEDDTLDELSMMLRARCLIKPDKTEYEITTAYGDKLRTHHIRIAGEEELKTPLGVLNTIRIEKRRHADSSRSTVFWLAPEMDYMLIRARHIEAPGLFGELRMISYEGPFQDKQVSMEER